MNTPFEERLSRDLEKVAFTVPLRHPEWDPDRNQAAPKSRGPGQRRWRRFGMGVVAGLCGAAAATGVAVAALGGSELFDRESAVSPRDRAAVIDELAADIPLPPGRTFDSLKGEQGYVEDRRGLAGTMAFVAVCEWAVHWEDGNAEQRSAAVEVLRDAPSRPQFGPTAGQSTLDYLRHMAEAAASGDTAKVAQFTTANDC